MMRNSSIYTGILALVLTLAMAAPVLAADKSPEYEENLEKLMNLEKQIRDSQSANEDKKAQIKKMEKKVDCNFTLLNAYKSCDESFKKGTDPYWACVKEAKQDFEQCTFE